MHRMHRMHNYYASYAYYAFPGSPKLINNLLFFAPKPHILDVFGHFHFVNFWASSTKSDAKTAC